MKIGSSIADFSPPASSSRLHREPFYSIGNEAIVCSSRPTRNPLGLFRTRGCSSPIASVTKWMRRALGSGTGPHSFEGARPYIVETLRKNYSSSEQRVGFIEEAAALDPEVDPLRVEASVSYFPIPWEARHWGFQLETLYKLIGNGPFGDVLLFPWLKPGGGEKYILQTVHELHVARPEKRILVLTGESARRHEWSTNLPDGSAFVDVFNAFPALSESDRDALVVRALLAVAEQDAFLHLKASPFAHRLMNDMARCYRRNSGSFIIDSAMMRSYGASAEFKGPGVSGFSVINWRILIWSSPIATTSSRAIARGWEARQISTTRYMPTAGLPHLFRAHVVTRVGCFGPRG